MRLNQGFSSISIIFLLGVVLMYSCNTGKQENGPDQIRQVISNFHEGIKRNDSVKIRAACTKDFKLAEDSSLYTTDSIIQYLKTIPGYTVDYTFSDYTAILDQQTAILTYNKKVNLKLKDSTMVSDHFESAFLLKENNEWKLYLLNTMTKKQGAKP